MDKFELFTDARKTYSKIFNDISKAKEYIFLEFYIIRFDNVGLKLRQLLIKKAQQGVDVRVIYDDVGSYATPYAFFDHMRDYGVKVSVFRPLLFSLSYRKLRHLHKRDHRKIVVIDDKIGYLGSMNIGSESLSYKDTMLRVEGEVTKKLRQAFFDYVLIIKE